MVVSSAEAVMVAGSEAVVLEVDMVAVKMAAEMEVAEREADLVGVPTAEDTVAVMATVVDTRAEAVAVQVAALMAGCLVEETGKAATPRLSTPQTESSDPSQCLPQERSARQS